MKHPAVLSLLCATLFSTALVAGKGPAAAPAYPDSLRSVYLYTDGIKQLIIHSDSAQAREFFTRAVGLDSTYAPAWFELASNQLFDSPAQGVEYAQRAYRQDTTNKWYALFYAQALVFSERYDDALAIYRRLRSLDPQNPEVYRMLALLFEQREQPFSAIATLDSAEQRFGRIPPLSAMKRRLLINTRQLDKAVAEAKSLVDAAPYEAQHHVALGDLYDLTGQDSLALAELQRALEIDSVDMGALMSLSDFYNRRQNYPGLLSTTSRLFAIETVPLETKIRRFEQFTSDRNFYRNFYPQINDLASTLAIRYPREKQVVELYADHLIASGELQQALDLYKLNLDQTPPQEEYYRAIIDIESFLQQPDSVNSYVDQALAHFPDKPEFHLSKGHVLVQSKQYTKAIQAYKSSLKYVDSDSLRGVVWGFIGDVWHQGAEVGNKAAYRKQMKQCYKAYDQSLRYYPDNPLVLNNYAYFLADENRMLEKALAMSSRAVALTDNSPTYLDTHAWVLFRLGRTAEARKIMQQAIALDRQNNPELQLHYGDILWALGEKFMAQIYWRKALENGYDAQAIATRLENSEKQ